MGNLKNSSIGAVLALSLLIGSFSIPRAYCSSTISESYEFSEGKEIGHEFDWWFRYKIYLSIQTEPDGTWRENKYYRGEIIVRLDWYNPELFPEGIVLVFYAPSGFYDIYLPPGGVNCTGLKGVNATLDSSTVILGYWKLVFFTPEERGTRVFIAQADIFSIVYNGTSSWLDRPSLYTFPCSLPEVYITLTDEEMTPLYQQNTWLNQRIENMENSLTNMQYLAYLLVALLAVSIAVNAFFGYSIKKAKRNELRKSS